MSTSKIMDRAPRRRRCALGALACVASLAGCVTSEVPLSEPLTQTRLTPGWLVKTDPAEVDRLARDTASLVDAPACLGARLLQAPEVAHALWLEAQGSERKRLSAAFAAAGLEAYAASDAAAAKDPGASAQAHEALARARAHVLSEPALALGEAEAVAEAFNSRGDDLLAAEAHLVAGAAALGAGEPLGEFVSLPTPVQVAQGELLRLAAAVRERKPGCDLALERALAASHGAVFERIVSAIERKEVLPPHDEVQLQLDRSALAAQRGSGELALLAAGRALRLAEAEAPSRRRTRRTHESHLALAQGRLLVNQPAEAVEEALSITEEGADLELVVRAESLAGQGLWASKQPGPAAQAYERAATAARSLSDSEALSRAQLNQASALLASRGDLDVVERCLIPVRGASAEGEARRGVLQALFSLLKGRVSGVEAARLIDASLQAARDAGAYAVVLRYDELPSRLREQARKVTKTP